MTSGHALTAWLECCRELPYSPSAHTYIKDLYFTIQDTTAPSDQPPSVEPPSLVGSVAARKPSRSPASTAKAD